MHALLEGSEKSRGTDAARWMAQRRCAAAVKPFTVRLTLHGNTLSAEIRRSEDPKHQATCGRAKPGRA
jgi:hypothetical protein